MYSFGPGKPNRGKDSFVKSFPEGLNKYEYLIFSDSKGAGSKGNIGNEWTIRLSEELKKIILVT